MQRLTSKRNFLDTILILSIYCWICCLVAFTCCCMCTSAHFKKMNDPVALTRSGAQDARVEIQVNLSMAVIGPGLSTCVPLPK